MTKTLAFILMVALAACRGEAEVRYSGDATTPTLVALDIDPSIQVVTNADEPIFYLESSYWLYRDNHWFRSSSHRSGWKRIDMPPEPLRRIDQPLAYVHYRPGSTAQRTTLNQSDQPPQPQAEPDRAAPSEPTPPDRAPGDPMRDPMREPNSQGPSQPVPNPPPPQQVPPSPDSDPTLRNPSSTRPLPPDQVPPTTPPRDRPGHQIAPDPDAKPTSPSTPGSEPQPASDPDMRDQGDKSKQQPDPAEAERNKARDRKPKS
jgi:hypothetical protein